MKTEQTSNSIGGGASFGPFGGSFKTSSSKASSDYNEEDRKNLLIENKKVVMDYYSSNCGSESYEESLKTEASLISLIANTEQINAWKECMLAKNGLFVRVTKAIGSGATDYNLDISWSSVENTTINDITLQYSPERVASEHIYNGTNWIFKTPNYCVDGIVLTHNANQPLAKCRNVSMILRQS